MSYCIKPARSVDAGDVGTILSDAVDALDWLPRLYTRAEEIAFAAQMIEAGWVQVARQDRIVLGFSARDGAELHCLYVARAAKGSGIGAALLDHAKTASATLGLWSYAADTGAHRFYKKQDFVETARGDGSGNDAGLPEIRFEWKRKG